MLVGKVLRPAAFDATLESLDASAARTLPGVTVVRDGDFVGVAAPDETCAAEAIRALRPVWKTMPQPSNKDLFQHLKENPASSAGRGRGGPAARGSIAEGMAAADYKQSATYSVATRRSNPVPP
jgi:isoquinoline 1-oxidoreductase